MKEIMGSLKKIKHFEDVTTWWSDGTDVWVRVRGTVCRWGGRKNSYKSFHKMKEELQWENHITTQKGNQLIQTKTSLIQQKGSQW